MKTIIIDDDITAIELLADLLKQYEDVEIVGTATSGKEGLELTKANKPHIIFLNMDLPDMSGMYFLEQHNEFSDSKLKTIIISEHSKFMLPSYTNVAFDYLTKPFTHKELDSILQKVYISQCDSAICDNPVIKNRDNDKILFYTNSIDFRLVCIREIGLFQYNHDLRVWEVILASKKEPIRMKRNTNNETLLAIDSRFVQVSQRYIINIDYLLEVTDNICHFYPPFDKIDYVKIGRMFRRKLIERFSTL